MPLHCTQLSIDFSDSPGELLRNQIVASTAPKAITRQQEQFLSILFHILHLKSLNMHSEKERKKRFNWIALIDYSHTSQLPANTRFLSLFYIDSIITIIM